MLVRARGEQSNAARHGSETVPFYGDHQAGIVTPQQHHLRFASFDLTATNVDRGARPAQHLDGRRRALHARGDTARLDAGGEFAPPDDTGEAGGLRPVAAHAHLRLRAGAVRRPLRPRRQAAGRADRPPPLPARPARSRPSRAATSASRPARTTRRSHSTRSATSPARRTAPRRCGGCRRASSRRRRTAPARPRNLMGFKDGTANLDPDDDERMGRNVWAAPGGAARWMAGGTLPRRPQDPDQDRAVGPHRARRAGAVRRPRRRIPARRSGGREEHDAVEIEQARRRLAHPPRQPAHGRRQRARAHPAPRLQLRRGRRRDRPDRRRALLPRLPAGPAAAVRLDPVAARERATCSTSTSSTRAARSSPSRRASSAGGSIGQTLFA